MVFIRHTSKLMYVKEDLYEEEDKRKTEVGLLILMLNSRWRYQISNNHLWQKTGE